MIYDARCADCDFEGEIDKPMADDFPTVCPDCGSEGLYQDYSKKNVICRDGSPKTFGQMSDANRKRMGKELSAMKDDECLARQPKKETPPWRAEGSKPLDVSTIKNIDHFIQTGEKS